MSETVFGTQEAIGLPTPKWATWLFRIVFLLTTAATFIIAAEPSIPDEIKVRIGLYMKGLDFLIWGVGRGMGIKKEDFEEDKK